MLRKIFIAISLVATLGLGSCLKPDDKVVEPVLFGMKVEYEDYGKTKPFPNPVQITLSSITEQLNIKATGDSMGNIGTEAGQTLKVSPGTYSINVTTYVPGDDGEEVTAVLNMANIKMLQGTVTLSNQELGVVGQNPIVFKEIYYAGAFPNAFKDSYLEIYNNSGQPFDMNSLYVAVSDPGGTGFGEKLNDWEPGVPVAEYKNIYAQNIWKVIKGDNPGVMLEPGKSVVLAVQALDHPVLDQNNNHCNLLGANYEAYPGTDFPEWVNNPDVPDMEYSFMGNQYNDYWQFSPTGDAFSIISCTVEEFASFERLYVPNKPESNTNRRVKIPVEFVYDGVDCMVGEGYRSTKRFPTVIDAGIAICVQFSQKMLVRKVKKVINEGTPDERKVLVDENNSDTDFLTIPTPPYPWNKTNQTWSINSQN